MRITKNLFVLFIGLFWVVAAQAAINIIPEPQHLTPGSGVFVLRSGEYIQAPSDRRAQWIAGFLRDHVAKQTGVKLNVGKAPSHARIILRIDPSIQGKNAYHLKVTPHAVILAAHDNRGLFWGVQTLRQLLPLHPKGKVTIPDVSIQDAPHYQWRGVMLDVVRHFYPISFIKKQIALMSYYKFNVFHWHLTGDQGWRIQIKRYPKLTRVGAWRMTNTGKRYGGFYTQKQIREVVNYARQRNVMVVPEIEMPGHTSAAIAAYPKLSCSGKPIPVPNINGVLRDVDCVGKPSTYKFLENVLDEVIPLFPSPYVHIGGDEVPQGVWAKCAACQKLAKTHGLKGKAGLHSYFIRKIQQYLTSKGKVMIGWSEIMEGGMDPNAIVEEWLGPEGTKKALVNGNRIIVAGPFYLNTRIKDMTLEDLYRHDPLKKPLYQKYAKQVLGAEAPLWGEFATPLNGEARLYPRLLALSEHWWNPSAHDWKSFQRRVKVQERWLASQDIAYGPADKDIVDYRLSFHPSYHRWRIRAARGFPNLRLHYTRDGSQPTTKSPSFRGVLDLYKPATITVAPFRDQRQYEASRTFRFVPNLALGDRVTFATPPNPPHRGSGLRLTNGILGDPGFCPDCYPLYHEAWDGWKDADMDATVHLSKPTTIHTVTVPFMEWSGVRVLLPRQVTIKVSNDGKTWTTLRTVDLHPKPDPTRAFVHEVTAKPQKPVTARYVRVVATRYGQSLHGAKTWIFCDQIIVQ